MSNSVRPHRRQPTRLLCSWDSPGKNTGVGCHFLLQCMKVRSESEVAQSCLTLSNPMDCSLPGSSVHGIFQARVLEWGAISFSRGLSWWGSFRHSTQSSSWPSESLLRRMCSSISDLSCYRNIIYKTEGQELEAVDWESLNTPSWPICSLPTSPNTQWPQSTIFKFC